MITALCLVGALVQEGGFEPPPPPPIIPSPRLSEPRFAPFTLGDSSRIVATEEGLEGQVRVVQRTLRMQTGRRIAVGEAPAKSGDITLTLGYLAEGLQAEPEAFSIEVFDDHVVLSGNGPAGLARAAARLPQLFHYDDSVAAWTLPPVRIDDAPRFPWRGLMLDLARFPHSIGAVEEAVELAFLSSFNVVHLHLSDDQAFTFPASCLPARTDAGQRGPDRGYTKEELAGLVRFAADRCVILVPEIDMPAHSGSLIWARPDLFGHVDPTSGEARPTRAVNMASTAAVDAMKELVAEVAEVFHTSPYFHLGGDELYAPAMLDLPEFAALMESEGLPSKGEPGAMNAFLNRFLQEMADHVEELGLQPIVWEGFRPAGEFTLENDVWVMAWNQHSQTPEALLEAGYPLINCGWEPLYVVPAQSWATTAEAAYGWNPASVRQRFGGRVADLAPLPDGAAPILGAQICVWEQRPEAVVPALLPLIPELSERMWASGNAVEPHGKFAPLGDVLVARLRAMLRPVNVRWQGELGSSSLLFQEKLEYWLEPVPHAPPGDVHYVVTDGFGAVPTSDSAKAGSGPVELTKSGVVAAALFDKGGERLGGVTEVRFERGVPVLSADVYRLPKGGAFGPDNFDGLGAAHGQGPSTALVGQALLMVPTAPRIDAINREQFARVVPDAHVDLRPIGWTHFGPAGERMDPARPRVFGRQAVRATGQLDIPESGSWILEMQSRGGVGRLTIGSASISCGTDNQVVTQEVALEAGTYGLGIDHAMLDVHNDLQIRLYRKGSGDPLPLTRFLRGTHDALPVADLLPLSSF